MCLCGHHPKTFLNTSNSLSQMTTHDMMNQLERWGFKGCKISDDGTGRIGITTESPLNVQQKEQIEASVPAGVRVSFTTSSASIPMPKGLEKWARDAKKYMK